jgi:enediyne biosynthesis protein E7
LERRSPLVPPRCLHPPAWTLPRRVATETKLGPYTVPANAIVQVDIGVMHRNPKYWKRPNEFYPQRWMEEEETSRHPFAYAPFSAGLRNCIGKNFAIQEMVIALSIIVSHFRLELDPAQPMIPKRNPLPFPYCFAKFHDRKL